MIVVTCMQGDEAWHRARAGVATASMFKTARERVGELTEQQSKYVAAVLGGATEKEAMLAAGYKAVPRAEVVAKALAGEPVGDWSDKAKNYAFRVAVERISGEPLDEGFETWAMSRGHELEPDARFEHEAQSGLVVQRAGFVLTEDRLFGCSADGFIGDDEGAEYKCLVSPERLRQVWIDNDISEFIDQVQGCLWITGRKRWHFGVYCPALEPIGKQLYMRVVERDDDYIEAMETDLLRFAALVDEFEAALRKEAA